MPPYPTLTSLVLLFLIALGAVLCSDGAPQELRPLVPVNKRSNGLGARQISRAGLRPRSEIWMPFGEGPFSGDRTALTYVTDIRISAHKDLPILLLEDFENLASSISCDLPSSLSVGFRDYSDFILARSEWLLHRGGFVLITSHPSAGCNPRGERAAYSVTRIECEEPTLTCTLRADAIEWGQVGSRMTVKYSQVTPEAFHGGLVRRELSSSSPESISKEFPNRFSLWPPTGNSNISIPLVPAGFFATCVGCSLSGDLGVDGEFDVDFVDGLPKVNKAWVQVNTSKAIKAVARVEVVLNASIPEMGIPLLPRIPFSGWTIPGIFTVGPYFEYSLVLAVDLKAKKLNFTFGAETEVPVNSVARFDMVGNNSLARGWDGTRVDRLPFDLGEIDGPFNVGLNATLTPAVGFTVELLRNPISRQTGFAAGPSIEFAAPRLVIETEEVRNVTGLCKPVGPEDMTYYPKAVRATTFYEVGISAILTAEADLPLPFIFEHKVSVDIYTYTGPKREQCLAFSGNPGVMIAVNETQPVTNETLPGEIDEHSFRGGDADTQRNASIEDHTNGAGNKRGVAPMWVGVFVGTMVWVVLEAA